MTAKKILTLHGFILYLQSFITGFFAGALSSSFTESVTSQGLAAGAIVLFNGFIGGMVFLFISVFVVFYTERDMVRLINRILLAVNVVIVAFLVISAGGEG